MKPEKNSFYNLATAVFEQIKSGSDFEHSYMSTFSLLLWKRLADKTGDDGFNQARTKAVSPGRTAELIHKAMRDFEDKYSEEAQGLFSQILRHISYHNEEWGMLVRFMDYLAGSSIAELFDQGSRHDYIKALEECGYSRNAKGCFGVSLNILRLIRAVLSIKDSDRVFAFGCTPAISILDSIVNEKCMSLYAQDVNTPHALMAKIHLALFNIDHSMVAAGNVFEHPAFVKDGRLETFDCVFGVPHMGTIPSQLARTLRQDRYGRFPDLLIDRFSIELAALAHALKVLRPKLGRAAIVLPQRFLSMMNTRKIRTYMVSMNYVDAIVSLPNYFFPGLFVDLALLIFKMNKQDKQVLFIDAEPLCSKADISLDQDKFLDIYVRRENTEHSMLVENTIILGRDASLFPSVYQETKPPRKGKSAEQLRDHLCGIDGKLTEVRNKLDESLSRLGKT